MVGTCPAHSGSYSGVRLTTVRTAEGKHRRVAIQSGLLQARSLGEGQVPHRRREAGTFPTAQKRSKKSWNSNRTGREIARRVYRVMRRKEAWE